MSTRGMRVSILAILAFGPHAGAQTVTVDTVEDVVDFGGGQRVEDLPGPDGRVSFREAVQASNMTEGVQRIGFAIPRDDWWHVDTMAVLKLETDPFFVRATAEIDFTTQTDFTGDTKPDGPEVGIYGLNPNGIGDPAIVISRTSDCVVRGLGAVWQRGSSIGIWTGDRNRVVGCKTDGVEINPHQGTTASFNVIGGTAPEDANDLEFVEIFCGGDDNVIVGNRLESVRIEGYDHGFGFHCFPQRNRVGGMTTQERNVIAGFGGFGAEGFPNGYGVLVKSAEATVIEGNFIGVDADGVTRIPSWTSGVAVADALDTTIRGNLIAGMWVEGHNHYDGEFFGEAILIDSINHPHVGVVIEGNTIGTDASGGLPILTRSGIRVDPVRLGEALREIRIADNIVAFTERVGISVVDQASAVEITGNSIHSNGVLGIDLAPFAGVTPNDEHDADENGGNSLQNFPVLDSAAADGSSLRVRGAVHSHPGRTYRIEVFVNGECDPSGHGEGERIVGAFEVRTDASGDASFDETIAGDVEPGAIVTATATDVLASETSEFSACVEASGDGCPADFNGDGLVNTQDVLAFLNVWAAQGEGADFNGDGAIDTRDVLTFLNAWSAGC